MTRLLRRLLYWLAGERYVSDAYRASLILAEPEPEQRAYHRPRVVDTPPSALWQTYHQWRRRAE